MQSISAGTPRVYAIDYMRPAERPRRGCDTAGAIAGAMCSMRTSGGPKMKKFSVAASLAAALMCTTAAQAAELEVTHWWTSGGESAAVAEFARLFNETGNTWVDSALAGSGTGANPVIISRILG